MRFVDRGADDVQLPERIVSRLQIDGDPDLWRGAGPANHAQIVHRCVQSFPSDIDLGLRAVQCSNGPFEAERTHRNPGTYGERVVRCGWRDVLQARRLGPAR